MKVVVTNGYVTVGSILHAAGVELDIPDGAAKNLLMEGVVSLLDIAMPVEEQSGEDTGAQQKDREDMGAQQKDGEDMGAQQKDREDMGAQQKDGEDMGAQQKDGEDMGAEDTDLAPHELPPVDPAAAAKKTRRKKA